MKKYGVFSGWFKLSGKRGRLSYLFSSIVTYILISIIYLFFIFLGLSEAALYAISGDGLLFGNSRYFIVSAFILIFVTNFWIITCIEVQRLRDIGLNSFLIFVIIIFSYSLWCIWVLSFYDFSWAFFGFLAVVTFELLMPSSKDIDEISKESEDYKSKISKNIISKNKIDPTL